MMMMNFFLLIPIAQVMYTVSSSENSDNDDSSSSSDNNLGSGGITYPNHRDHPDGKKDTNYYIDNNVTVSEGSHSDDAHLNTDVYNNIRSADPIVDAIPYKTATNTF